jgi:hypothetical protein
MALGQPKDDNLTVPSSLRRAEGDEAISIRLRLAALDIASLRSQ